MDGSSQTGLFDLADRRLAWLSKRQELLAQNVANANTPGFKARDLKPFAATLQSVLGPAQTQPAHLAGTVDAALQDQSGRLNHQKSPDGNAVELDEELMKVANTETSQELVTNLYSKYLGMFRTAFGRGQ